jgi:hypothetical protein
MSTIKERQKVAVINMTLGGKFFIETFEGKVMKDLGGGYYRVRIGKESFERFVDPAAQDNPLEYVAKLNASGVQS